MNDPYNTGNVPLLVLQQRYQELKRQPPNLHCTPQWKKKERNLRQKIKRRLQRQNHQRQDFTQTLNIAKGNTSSLQTHIHTQRIL
jgi:hypothetical protein